MRIRSVVCLSAALACGMPAVADVPPGFVDQIVVGGWNQAVGVTFDASGKAFVWEKGGRVWRVVNGVRDPEPVIDISQEVGDWRDLGLLGFALDPNFATNGHIYLLYTVDYHHLRYFGTPQYSPTTDEYFRDTIGRLTRYTCEEHDGQLHAHADTRLVLIGETMSTGIPCAHQSHHIGTVAFGGDGSLLVGAGDGASYEEVDNGGPRNGSSNTALADGIITQAENVGAFRSQLPDSLAGKILRIDPATGNGMQGNPYYNAASPRSARSRVWALGFRNPFRWSVRPGTGGSGAGPGTLYVGDVGWFLREEINVIRSGGQNCGWPLFEGLTPSTVGYVAASPFNRSALNPLFPAQCADQYFRFRDLIVQDTLAAPSWPNPCNPGLQVPASIPRFKHTRPAMEYGHGGATRVGIYSGNNAAEIDITAPGSPVAGVAFPGDSVTGGVWVTGGGLGGSFPTEWRDRYYAADFVGGRILAMTFDAADRLIDTRTFQTTAGSVVCLAQSPDGWLYYIAYDQVGNANLRRISYGTDGPPVAAIAATPRFGPLPLTVTFSSAGSRDPEGLPVSYFWDFGDGSFSTEANPTHTYTGARDITAGGTFIARVNEFSPPGPQGGGNRDPEILRDGFYPPVGGNNSFLQYDTFHFGDQNTPDGSGDDWIGWTFPEAWTFTGLIFQEGIHFFDGGWFDSRRVEVRGTDGVWRQAPGLVFRPSYFGNNGVNFEAFLVSFDARTGTGIRLRGNPGGSANFISAAELRVLAQPLNNTAPQRFDPVLYVIDGLGQVGAATTIISPNNTPPVIQIVSPVDGSVFNDTAPQQIPLTATVTDAEHPPAQLSCRWDVILRHDDHAHPEPPIFDCQSQARIEGHGDVGDVFFWLFQYTVTDAHGLSTTATARIDAACRADFNADGFVDFFDYDGYVEAYETGTPFADFNRDGFIDFFDYDGFVESFEVGCP
jgi:glucose/arabinose dehydrogenase